MEVKILSNADYHKAEGVSSTDLKKIAKSPAHFRYWKDNPQEDTPSLLLGRAAHKYVLEKEDFFNEFEIARDFKYGSKTDKEETQSFICNKAIELGKGEEWDSFIVTNPKKEDVVAFYRSLIVGKDIISADDFDKIKAMYEVLQNTPFIKTLLYGSDGENEVSYFVKDEITGVVMKCRPDRRTTIGSSDILIDYKTTSNADSDKFMKQAIDLMYDLQMAYYKDNVDAVTGKQHSVIFIAQETTAPYCVNILEANEYFIKSGRDMYRTMLNRYAECESTGNWYGYMQGEINSLGLPNWLQKQYEV